ncbi:hypothetical protein, partial [Acinetobacter baumannii]|uniref:hypothetical protein n=1 Tax=Acinetobacter baumannii TaxID=470 RepID=UPI001C0A4638
MAIVNLGHRVRRARAQTVTEQVALAVTDEDAPWLLDRQGQVLRSSGSTFAKLSARETILLEYMAQRPG